MADLVGCETPRLFTPPLRELTAETSLGFEVVEFAEQVLGLELLPWQRWLIVHALELREDGTFRFRNVVVLVGRQNGKSLCLSVLSLWWMYAFGMPLTIGTAQKLDVAEEQWQVAVDMAESVPELKSEIAHVNRTNGKKALRLKSGPRYKVASASRRGGRGLSGDLVLLDELREHQSWEAWAAVTKTTMARASAQVWAASNAGDASSVVLRFLRQQAHADLGDPDGFVEREDRPEEEQDVGEVDDDSLGIFEWSAPPGCDIWDREGWCQANPALGHLIGERAVVSAAKTDPEWVFRTEVLCQWLDRASEGPFPPGAWESCEDEDSKIADGSDITLCVDVSWDRSVAHVAAAGLREDGRAHIEVVKSGVGVDWVVGWLSDGKRPWPVALQSKRAPVTSLKGPLFEAGVEVVDWDGVSGTAELYDRVRASADEQIDGPTLRHLGQPALNQAAANAATRPVGDMWAWDRRKSPVDISPLVSCTGALWCLNRVPDEEPLTPGIAIVDY